MNEFKISERELEKFRNTVREINENLSVWARGVAKAMNESKDKIESAFKEIHPPAPPSKGE